MHALPAVVDGSTRQIDARDVAAWLGVTAEPVPADPVWQERAQAYVDAHPRPDADGHARAQRLALLRRLAAGPAARGDLLAALRRVGWVGASDLDNRLRELRPGTRRGTPGAPGIVDAGGVVRLAEPFPTLDASATRGLAFAKAILDRLDGPLAALALAALDGLVPGVASGDRPRLTAKYRASAATLERFEAARDDGRPVRVRYFSMNSGFERAYELVPVRYVTLGSAVKALCVPVDAAGQRTGVDRQFALDRLLEVQPLPGWSPPLPRTLRLHEAPIALDVSHGLYQVLVARDLLGIRAEAAEQVEVDAWRVRGAFPTALAWDVMEQLCAWAGSAQVREPLWLVNAVCRRLRKGLAVMETGEGFELVKPDPQREFATHGDAVSWEPQRRAHARKLAPRR